MVHGAPPCLAPTNKSLAQMNKSPKVAAGVVQKIHSGRRNSRPVTQSGRAEYRDIRPALLTGPSQQWLGPFRSMAATNKSLARKDKSLDRSGATKGRHTPLRPGGIGIFWTRTPVAVTSPPTDAQVIVGTILGIASMFARGRY